MNKKGYGAIGLGGRHCPTRATHRIAYELHVGVIPEGMLICHRCDTPSCCNPAHLFLGTPADNTSDMMAKGRYPVGEAHWNSKLTAAEVAEIRGASGSQLAIAQHFGISQQRVSEIKRREGRIA